MLGFSFNLKLDKRFKSPVYFLATLVLERPLKRAVLHLKMANIMLKWQNCLFIRLDTSMLTITRIY